MKNPFIYALFLFLVLQSAPAQNIGYGVKFGGELHHLWDSDFNFSSPGIFFTGGAFFKVGFLGILAAQLEIDYIRKGGDYSHSTTGFINSFFSGPNTQIPITITRITEYKSLDFPLFLKIYAPGFVGAKPHLLVGGFYGYMLGERDISFTFSGVDGTTPITPDLLVSGQLAEWDAEYGPSTAGESNPHEFGIVLGGGIDFSLGTFDVRYALGLTEIEKEAAPGREKDISRTGTVTLMVGFEF